MPATPTSDSPPWGACMGQVVPGLVGGGKVGDSDIGRSIYRKVGY